MTPIPPTPTNETILEEAARIVEGTRNNEYGTPFVNHSRTASFWSVYLGIDITPEQVCMLNILQKLSRSMNSITRDTLVDFAGYARNIEKIQDEREGQVEEDKPRCEHGETEPHKVYMVPRSGSCAPTEEAECHPGLRESLRSLNPIIDVPKSAMSQRYALYEDPLDG